MAGIPRRSVRVLIGAQNGKLVMTEMAQLVNLIGQFSKVRGPQVPLARFGGRPASENYKQRCVIGVD
jgi:hypothetical protein